MKLATLSLVLSGFIIPLSADDLVTRDGKIYHDYKVVGHDDGYLTILYADGGGKIPLKNLPDDLQKTYQYDPARADAFVQNAEAADRQERLAIEQSQQNGQGIAGEINTSPSPSVTSLGTFQPAARAPASDTPSSEVNSDLQLAPDTLGPDGYSPQLDGTQDGEDHESRVVSYGDSNGVWVSYVDMGGLRHEEFRRREELRLGEGHWTVVTDSRGFQHYQFKERGTPQHFFTSPAARHDFQHFTPNNRPYTNGQGHQVPQAHPQSVPAPRPAPPVSRPNVIP